MEAEWVASTQAIIDGLLGSPALEHWWILVAVLQLAGQTLAILHRRPEPDEDDL